MGVGKKSLMQDVSKIGFGGRLVRESDKTADKGLTAGERSGQKRKGREGGFQGPLGEGEAAGGAGIQRCEKGSVLGCRCGWWKWIPRCQCHSSGGRR